MNTSRAGLFLRLDITAHTVRTRTPERDLAAAILYRAILDARAHRNCGVLCKRQGHVCQRDAVKFLASPLARNLADPLGLEDIDLLGVIDDTSAE